MNWHANFILHVNTLGISPNKIQRLIFDYVLSLESLFFKNIAIISSGIAKKIGVKKYHLLPLGGHCFCTRPKSFDKLSLLYVGTLSNRNILKSVKGFKQFVKKEGSNGKHSFAIVGNSPFGELEEIKQYIKDHNLESYIQTPGFINSDRLYPFFENANIGVSFVPITAYYNHQPPTKTYEYLISGLPVIATSTYANKEIVSEKVSELIADNANDFYNAILKIQGRKQEFDSDEIRDQYKKYTWRNVVKENLVPWIKLVLKSK